MSIISNKFGCDGLKEQLEVVIAELRISFFQIYFTKVLVPNENSRNLYFLIIFLIPLLRTSTNSRIILTSCHSLIFFVTSEYQVVNLLYNKKFMQPNTHSSSHSFFGFLCSFFMIWHILQWNYGVFAQDSRSDPCYLPPNVNNFWLGPVPTYETFFF
jgi:hypothetical protein